VVAIGGGADPLRLEGFWKDGWLRWDAMLRADGTDAGLIFSHSYNPGQVREIRAKEKVVGTKIEL
jgi:hypothetical protein